MKTSTSKASLTQSLVTVSGAVAATVASTQAATVQITLTNNQYTMMTNTNTLNADVTGDGIYDILITNPRAGQSGGLFYAAVNINGTQVAAGFSRFSSYAFAFARAAFANGGKGLASSYNSAGNLASAKYLNPISFTDARINSGALTQGYLEVIAFNDTETLHTIALTRLVFDDASTTLGTSGLSTDDTYTEFGTSAVPEPSSLGLLALGAGGLLARRRRQAA